MKSTILAIVITVILSSIFREESTLVNAYEVLTYTPELPVERSNKPIQITIPKEIPTYEEWDNPYGQFSTAPNRYDRVHVTWKHVANVINYT